MKGGITREPRIERFRPWRRGRFFAPLLLLIVTIFLPAPPVHAEVVDRIVAVVNESVITLSELNAAAAAVEKGGGRTVPQGEEAPFRSRVLDRIIERKLVEHASARVGITVSEKEIDAAIEDVKSRNNLSHDELLVALAGSGLTYKEYREKLKAEIEQVKFTNRRFRSKATIPDEDIENYYRQNREEFYGPDSYRLGMISIYDPDGVKAEAAITEILARLQNGEDFEEIARRHSDGPNAGEGGDLGFLFEGELDETIRVAVKELAVGEFSGIITTPAGPAIIRLIDKREGKARPLEEVRDEIHSILFQRIVDERYRAWLEKMKEISHIDIRL
ncbi:MAG: peptidyl-prolyl cis-trans isomerase [Thermodesulfobacteriota bacterium]